MNDLKSRPQCFTVTFHGRVNVLLSPVNLNDPILNPIVALNLPYSPDKNKYIAIWDTGATGSCISERVVQDMHLQPTGMVKMQTASGVEDMKTYVVDLLLPNGVAFSSIKVTGVVLQEADVLIGMDIIGSGDLAVSTHEGVTIFSYRHPNAERIDFVHNQNISDKALFNPGNRNQPCRCGSRKKYKDCHGI